MICEACQQNLATVHLTEIIQKTKKETHLCETCAQDKGVTYSTDFSVKDFLGGLSKKSTSEPAESAPKQAAAAPVAPAVPKAEAPVPCPSCGITFQEFRQSGRLGCYRDYEHFEPSLLPLLRKIHNDTTQHTGRVPSQIGERMDRARQISDLRAKLEQAVSREHYERAAELRDSIRQIEESEEDPE